MPDHVRMALLAFPALLLAGCAHIDVGAPCERMSRCAREGILTLHLGDTASVGVLTMPNGCLALALPRRTYRHASEWEGRRVRVLGELWGQPDWITNYRIGMRWVSPSTCSTGDTLYVRRIERLD